jgi:hypothetical protein
VCRAIICRLSGWLSLPVYGVRHSIADDLCAVEGSFDNAEGSESYILNWPEMSRAQSRRKPSAAERATSRLSPKGAMGHPPAPKSRFLHFAAIGVGMTPFRSTRSQVIRRTKSVRRTTHSPRSTSCTSCLSRKDKDRCVRFSSWRVRPVAPADRRLLPCAPDRVRVACGAGTVLPCRLPR